MTEKMSENQTLKGPVFGWSSVKNAIVKTLGQNLEHFTQNFQQVEIGIFFTQNFQQVEIGILDT